MRGLIRRQEAKVEIERERSCCRLTPEVEAITAVHVQKRERERDKKE